MSANWLEQLRNHPRLLPPEARARNGSNRVLALLGEFAASERLPQAELTSRQRVQLRALARHANTRSSHFAARLQRAGLTPDELAEPGGLAALPPLTRRALVEAGETLFCRSLPPEHGKVTTTSTSGSTGEPVTVRRPALCHLQWLACSLREHLWCRHDFAARFAVVRANITDGVSRPDWGPPVSLLFRTGPAEARPATQPVEELVSWLIAFSPQHLLSLPGSLAAIVASLQRTGQRLPGLTTVRTVSETVSTRLREQVSRAFGARIQDSYSSQEGGIMATQCPEAGTYHVSEHILLEIVTPDGRPCAPGQTGRILVTDLLNYATPLIRYEIGDYAEVGESCSCGRSLAPIRRFLGRERNLVLLPDGTRHWPLVGFHRWDEVFPVRQFQFIQTDRQSITAKMSADSRPDATQEERLTTIIQEALGHPFVVRYEWQTEPLPRGPGGKFEEFQCRAS